MEPVANPRRQQYCVLVHCRRVYLSLLHSNILTSSIAEYATHTLMCCSCDQVTGLLVVFAKGAYESLLDDYPTAVCNLLFNVALQLSCLRSNSCDDFCCLALHDCT